jgi:hypothetical protein
LPAFLNNVLDTKFKIVFGYPGGQHIDLAMERGEVEGRGANPYSDYMASKPDYIPKKLINPLIQIGRQKEPGLPDVPLLIDQKVRPEDRPVIEFMTSAVMIGRPLATTPGVPAERVAALRQAFEATVKDPEFIADADRQHAEIRPMSGEAMTKLIDDLIGAPKAVRDRVKTALEPKSSDAKDVSGGKRVSSE